MKKKTLAIVLMMSPCIVSSYFTIADLDQQAVKKSKMIGNLLLDQEKRRDEYQDVKTYSLLLLEQEETFVQLYKWFKDLIHQEGQAVGSTEAIVLLDTFMSLMLGDEIELPNDDILFYYENLLEIFDHSPIKDSVSRLELCKMLKTIIENRFY